MVRVLRLRQWAQMKSSYNLAAASTSKGRRGSRRQATPLFTLVLSWALSNSFFCAFFSSSGFLFYSCLLLLVTEVSVVVSSLMVAAAPPEATFGDVSLTERSWGGRGWELSAACM